MKTISIHQKLVRSLSLSITAVTIIILLLTDVAVDTWVHNEFKRAMTNKANLLTTLVEENRTGVEFDFAGEFMPEFEGASDPEYYQLWRNGAVFERSDTLSLFSINDFAYQDLKINSRVIKDIILPDGRSGQILYYRFLPQIESQDRDDFQAYLRQTGQQQQPMLLAYAASSETVNFLMLLIDITFFVAAVSVALIVIILVKRTVEAGLAPLDEMTQQLATISLADHSTELALQNKVKELLPIQDSINTFIRENKKLYNKEQRMSSDIAHELKTPIAELINLTEVSLKFPNDKTLSTTFAPDVLAISLRLEKIVANILLLHRYSNPVFEKNDIFDVSQVIHRLADKYPKVSITSNAVVLLSSNLFAFETIMLNLLQNASNYSPENSVIDVAIATQSNEGLLTTICNICTNPPSNDELALMFEPLWQKDQSRTSTENFGLGLSIVNTFTCALGGNINVTLEQNIITFSLFLPK
jgi:signal transduction histidine kinase